MYEGFSDNVDDGPPVRFTPDPDDPWDHNRLFDILRLLRFEEFHVSEADIWGDPGTSVLIHVEGWDEPLKDFGDPRGRRLGHS